MPLVSRKKKKKIIWGLFHGVLVSFPVIVLGDFNCILES